MRTHVVNTFLGLALFLAFAIIGLYALATTLLDSMWYSMADIVNLLVWAALAAVGISGAVSYGKLSWDLMRGSIVFCDSFYLALGTPHSKRIDLPQHVSRGSVIIFLRHSTAFFRGTISMNSGSGKLRSQKFMGVPQNWFGYLLRVFGLREKRSKLFFPMRSASQRLLPIVFHFSTPMQFGNHVELLFQLDNDIKDTPWEARYSFRHGEEVLIWVRSEIPNVSNGDLSSGKRDHQGDTSPTV